MSRGGQPIASAYAEVGFRDTGFDAGIARATSRLSAFASAIPQLLGGAAVATGFTMLVGQVTKTINALDSLRDRARETQTPIEQLSRLEFAGGLSGIEDVTGMLRFLQRNLAEAANGNKELSETFKRLGVDAGGFVASGRPAVELMSTLIDSLLRAPRAQGVRDAMQIFGRSGSEVFKFGSGAELTQGMAMADRVGATVTQEMADSADEFNDAVGKLRQSFESLQRDAVVPLLPALTEIVEWVRRQVSAEINTTSPSDAPPGYWENFLSGWDMTGGAMIRGLNMFGGDAANALFDASSIMIRGRRRTRFERGLPSIGVDNLPTEEDALRRELATMRRWADFRNGRALDSFNGPFGMFGVLPFSEQDIVRPPTWGSGAGGVTTEQVVASMLMRASGVVSERSSAANERYADAISAVFDRMDEINRMSSRVMPAMTGVGSWWDTAQNGIVSNDERERMRVAQESLDRLTAIAETAKETADVLRERLASTPTFAN